MQIFTSKKHILDYLRNQRYDKIEDMKYEKIKEYKEEKNRRITGLKKKTYEKCVETLRAKYKEEHGGANQPC